jgi:rubrerythrin
MEQLRCPECGELIDDNASVCPHCGFPIEGENAHIKCPKCGFEIESKGNITVCPNCAFPFGGQKKKTNGG